MGRNERDEKGIIEVTKDGVIEIYPDGDGTEANGTNTVTITNVAPSAVGTATISRWLITRIDGVNYYIPMWT